jgi:hypothetical protein
MGRPSKYPEDALDVLLIQLRHGGFSVGRARQVVSEPNGSSMRMGQVLGISGLDGIDGQLTVVDPGEVGAVRVVGVDAGS